MKRLSLLTVGLVVTMASAISQATSTYGDRWDNRTYTKDDVEAFDNKTSKGNGYMFSVLAGANYASLAGTGESPAARQGITAGAFYDLGGGNLVFEMGVMFREMGTEEQLLTFANGSQARGELNLDYLSVPLSAKYFFHGRQGTSVYGKAGMMVSFLLSNQARQESTATYYDLEMKKSDYGPLLGLGAKIDINNQLSLILEGTYYRGLVSIVESFEAYNQSFGISAGIGF